MRIRLAGLLAVVAVLSACSNKPKDATSTTDQVTTSSTSGGIGQGGLGTIQPGTQADLAANVGDRVLFDYDRSDLSPDARATLDRQAAWLKKYPQLQVTIEGHCDQRGTREYNLALGEKRATSARNYLVSQGIPANRLRTVSYGKERPAVTGTGDAVDAQNRRAVTVVE